MGIVRRMCKNQIDASQVEITTEILTQRSKVSGELISYFRHSN